AKAFSLFASGGGIENNARAHSALLNQADWDSRGERKKPQAPGRISTPPPERRIYPDLSDVPRIVEPALMGKLQAPSTKPQGNFKHQVPRHPRRVGFYLEFGIWSFLGAWCLVFGVFIALLSSAGFNGPCLLPRPLRWPAPRRPFACSNGGLRQTLRKYETRCRRENSAEE